MIASYRLFFSLNVKIKLYYLYCLQRTLEIKFSKSKINFSLYPSLISSFRHRCRHCFEDLYFLPTFLRIDFRFLGCLHWYLQSAGMLGVSRIFIYSHTHFLSFIYSNWGCKMWGQFKCLCCYVLPHQAYNAQTKKC